MHTNPNNEFNPSDSSNPSVLSDLSDLSHPSKSTEAPKTAKTPGHFKHFQSQNPKTPAISNNDADTLENPRHFQGSDEKISETPTPPRPRRIKSLLSELSSDTIEILIELCEELPNYREVARAAREKLGLQISPSSLCRLYTNHNICEDAHTHEDYLLDSGVSLLNVAEEQLELRLVELINRPNPEPEDIHAAFKITTRLRALTLAERRVQVSERRIQLAEAREERLNNPPVKKSLPPEEVKRRVRVLLGKEPDSSPARSQSEAERNMEPFHDRSQPYDEPA